LLACLRLCWCVSELSFLELKNRGLQEVKQRNFAQAVKWFTEAIKKGKRNVVKNESLVSVYHSRYKCFIELKQPKEARADLGECLRIDGNHLKVNFFFSLFSFFFSPNLTTISC
jgi:tetratricopeptide (TPR) repeat protein